MNYLHLSAYGSLALQFITGLIETSGLYATIPEKDKILQDILTMELLVQIIEFIFYYKSLKLIFPFAPINKIFQLILYFMEFIINSEKFIFNQLTL